MDPIIFGGTVNAMVHLINNVNHKIDQISKSGNVSKEDIEEIYPDDEIELSINQENNISQYRSTDSDKEIVISFVKKYILNQKGKFKIIKIKGMSNITVNMLCVEDCNTKKISYWTWLNNRVTLECYEGITYSQDDL